MKIATWNVNSVRMRLPLVLRFLEKREVHVLCLQEIKCEGETFPWEEFAEVGYRYVVVRGRKAYNGVAILSRFPFVESGSFPFCDQNDARHVFVRLGPEAGCPSGLSVHNFYVPAGGEEPDPISNPKFAHKLAFLKEMKTFLCKRMRESQHAPSLLVGDFNVAPLENDVWSHAHLLDVVSHTPVECRLLNDIMSLGWVDAMRLHVPLERKLYTWWSYRAADWRRSDRGRRLDHIWTNSAIAEAVSAVEVFKEARGWDKPSDHAPVIASIDGTKIRNVTSSP